MLQLFQRRTKKTKGFTLIELIVVIAILAILALIAIPRLAGFQEQARQANDRELASIIAHSTQTLIASGDIRITGVSTITVTGSAAPLAYAPSATILPRTGAVAITNAQLLALLEPLVGNDKFFQTAASVVINIEDDGDIPIESIGYTW